MYTAVLIFLGCCVGYAAAHYTVLPLPYMLAPLITVALISIKLPQFMPADYKFPMRFRLIFIAIIGVMIGTSVTIDLIKNAADYIPSMIAIMAFVVVAHIGNILIFRHWGGYDTTTAFYAGSPGGLMESIAMGEAAGSNVQLLMLQQFLRIIITITMVPIGLSLWLGTPVGSASGATFSMQDHIPTFTEGMIALVVGGIGLWAGLAVKMPAGQLMGPLLAAAIVTVFGMATIDLPTWVIHFAQVVIGVSLGCRFRGISQAAIRKGIWLSFASVSFMLILGAVLSALLLQMTDISGLVLLISFAPGGMTEMSLIALSLSASPALVSMHHLFRIVVTVVSLSVFGPRPQTKL